MMYNILVAVVCSLALTINSAYAQDSNANMEFSISGSVKDAKSEKAVKDALVVLSSESGMVAETKTNGRGKYVFEKNEEGARIVTSGHDYTVTVKADGWAEASQDESTKGADDSSDYQLDFLLEKK